ncbi:MAG: hypothetical protein Q9227_002149 [Pyrenula ochraceoflavens]
MARSPALPFPSNPVLNRAQTQWLFTAHELARAPSILDGYDLVQEHANRAKGVNFITQVGILLKLPQLTLATASVYLHRFFMRYSMVDLPNRPGLHYYAIAATSLFLATKVEENCRKMRELVVACCRVAQKQPNLLVDEQSKEFWRWRDTILHNEDLLLEALCFDLQLEQPYRILFDFLCYYGTQDNKRLRNAAWAFVNDSHLTVLCLLFSARTIAASALYAAAKHTEVGFPDDEYGRPWWEHLGVDIGEMKRACNQMAEAYSQGRLPKSQHQQEQQGVYVVTPEGEGQEAVKTRIIGPPVTPRPRPPSADSRGSQGVKRSIEQLEGQDGRVERNGTASGQREDSSRSNSQNERAQPPSPKRQKVTETVTNGHAHNTAPQPPPSTQTNGRPPSQNTGVDDIQSRIDSIVNSRPGSHPSSHTMDRLNSNSYSRRRSRSPPYRDRDRDRDRGRGRDTYIGAAGRNRERDRDRARRSYSRGDDRDRDRERPGGRREDSGNANELPKGDERVGSAKIGDGEEEGAGSEEGEL